MEKRANANDRRVEANYDLSGQTISSAAARLTELAAQMDYHAVASGPRTYQLVRRRRQHLRLRTETMTLTFVEDRSGPRVLVVGDVDTVLLEHLTGRPEGQESQVPSTEPSADDTTLHPSFGPPTVNYELPSDSDRMVRPAIAPVGLISQVPGAQRQPEPLPPPLVVVPSEVATPFAAPPRVAGNLSAPADAVLTVKRDVGPDVKPDSAAPVDQVVVATLVMPDGSYRPFTSAMIVGRNPSPTSGPKGMTPIVIDDSSLSKSHCVIELTGPRLIVTDLHSTNGTRVAAGGSVLQLVPGQPSPPLPMPAVVWAGEVPIQAQINVAGTGDAP